MAIQSVTAATRATKKAKTDAALLSGKGVRVHNPKALGLRGKKSTGLGMGQAQGLGQKF